MKKSVRLILSILLTAIVCAVVVFVVHQVTRNRIAALAEQRIENAARVVMPKAIKKVERLGKEGAVCYAGLDAQGKIRAYALVGRTDHGYGGPLVLMVGFLPDRTVVTYRVLEQHETPGLGTNLDTPEFLRQFRGVSAKRALAVRADGGTIEALTSATITSRAVCDAINDAGTRLNRFQ